MYNDKFIVDMDSLECEYLDNCLHFQTPAAYQWYLCFFISYGQVLVMPSWHCYIEVGNFAQINKVSATRIVCFDSFYCYLMMKIVKTLKVANLHDDGGVDDGL